MSDVTRYVTKNTANGSKDHIVFFLNILFIYTFCIKTRKSYKICIRELFGTFI